MNAEPTSRLTELELDALWTIYEGHSLVIERPQKVGTEAYAHAVLSVAYDDQDEAVAEVAMIPLDTVEGLVSQGLLERSEDGPVLDADSWYDDELGCEILAEEYILTAQAHQIIDATADAVQASDHDFDFEEEEGDWDDEDDWDDDDEENDADDDDDDSDEDGEADD